MTTSCESPSDDVDLFAEEFDDHRSVLGPGREVLTVGDLDDDAVAAVEAAQYGAPAD